MDSPSSSQEINLAQLQENSPPAPTHDPIIDIAAAKRKRMTAEQVAMERTQLELKAVLEFNKRHAVAMINGRAHILIEEPDDLGNPSFVLASERDLNLFYRNKNVSLPKATRQGVIWEKQPITKIWLGHDDRQQFTKIVFRPSGIVRDGEYNIFKGWGVTPAPFDPEKPTLGCEKIVDLCRRVVGTGAHGDWGMAWLADLFQNPENKPGTALVLRSKEGAGKGTLMNHILAPILQNAYVHIANRRYLTGNFNSILQGTLLFFADEAIWAGDKEGEGALKALITEPTLMIEYKGKEAFRISNPSRLVFASNEKWVVPVGERGRRFHVVDCDEEMAQNVRYFEEVRKEADNGGREAFFSYLLNFDTSGFDLRNPPVTDALISQKIQTLRTDSVGHWLFERLYDGALFGSDDSLTTSWPREITRERVRASYATYCKRMNVKYPASAEEIGSFLKEKLGVGAARASSKGTDGTRPMLYVFKSPDEDKVDEKKVDLERLEYWRGVFEAVMFGGRYEWPDYEPSGESKSLIEAEEKIFDDTHF